MKWYKYRIVKEMDGLYYTQLWRWYFPFWCYLYLNFGAPYFRNLKAESIYEYLQNGNCCDINPAFFETPKETENG